MKAYFLSKSKANFSPTLLLVTKIIPITKMTKNKGIHVYRLTDYSLDQIVKNHELAELDYYGGNVKEKKFVKPSAIERKKLLYSILIHTIIKWCERSENRVAILNSQYLKKKYRNGYVVMLHNLEMLDIIDIDHNYLQNVCSKGYRIKDGVKYHIERINSKDMIDELIPHESEIIKQCRAEKDELIESTLTPKVAKRYEQSLKCIQLEHPTLAEEYVKTYRYPSESARDSRLLKIQDFRLLKGKFVINGIDANNRIYHVLTNCPRDIKSFLNIKFACDCHNSHPLLFNLNIIEYYGLDTQTIYKMFDVMRGNDNLDINNIRKTLIDGGVVKQSISNIPQDALYYIYLTSRGLFWDFMLDSYGSISSQYDGVVVTRSDIKLQMFAQVFYRKKLNNTTNKETGEKRYPLASLFNEKFPTVSKIVRNEKRKDSNPENRKELPSNMMKVESKIYHEILAEIYKLNPKYKVFNIHDAIEVLDVPENESLTVDIVKQVMEQVYRRNGLMPDLSVDYPENIDQLMSDLTLMNQLIDAKLEELRQRANAGDEQAIVYSYAINHGYLEFIWSDSSHQSVSLHLTDKVKSEEISPRKICTQSNDEQQVKWACGKKVFYILGEESKKNIMTMKGWLDYENGKRVNNYDLLDNYRRDYKLVRNNGRNKARYTYKVDVIDGEVVNSYLAIKKYMGRNRIK